MVELVAENWLARLSLLVLLFIAVGAGSFAVVSLLGSRRVLRERLTVATEGPSESSMGSLRTSGSEGAWLSLINAIERTGLSLVDTKDDTLRRRLAAAGFRAPYAARVYTLVRLVLVIGLPLLLLGGMWFAGIRPSLLKLYFVAAGAGIFGLYLPATVVRIRADRRQQQIINGFPDALDLMLVSVEAGLGLESAFARVGMEMTHSHPLIAEQLGNVVLELRAGRSREDALRRMADRASADEIRAFATLLIQSTKLGSSIAQTLRVYSTEMREKRRMRAEEKAHRLPVLLSLPLVGCMLPVMIGVLLLPAVIRVIRSVIPTMSGG